MGLLYLFQVANQSYFRYIEYVIKIDPINVTQTNKVIGVRRLTKTTFGLKLERNGFQFTPGQCVNIGLVDSAINREYSTYSGLHDGYLEFLVKEVDEGMVSPQLGSLNPGDEVSLDGAYGLFTIKEPKKKGLKYLFVASGTGIAPFHCYVKSYPGINYKVLHGVRLAEEQYDRDFYGKGRYISCVSREKKGDFHGRVTDYLKKHPVDPETICYLCGNKSMINDVYDILREQEVGGSNIVTEVFF